MTDPIDLLVLGECNVDLLVRGVPPIRFGQAEQLVESTTLTIGSSGVITACAAASMGLRVTLVGVVGDDVFGRFLVEGIERLGVEAAVELRDDQQTGSTLILERAGERALLTHMGSIGALRAADVPLDLLARARHVHISAWFLQDGLSTGARDLLAVARNGGATTSLDPNWDPSEQWDLHDVLEEVDLFLPNEQEFLAITGADTAEDALASWDSGRLGVVVKRGRAGASGVLHGERVSVAAPGIETVDTTGAGDNFDAAVIAGLLRGMVPLDAVRAAVAAGSLSTRGVGGTGCLPTWGQVLELSTDLTT